MQRLPNDQFPHGLRVLLVSNDQAILRSVEKVSSQCNYQVNVFFEATVALNHLREKKDSFDLVLFDDYMSDMDGYKFIEHVQLEINLPVIMISGDDRTSSVMKGLRSGASDYLIKPVSEEVLRNIWQHAWRRNAMNVEGNHDDVDAEAEAEFTSFLVDATREEGVEKAGAKRSGNSVKDEGDGELVNTDPPLKKRRVVWSTELHAKFVEAVNKLGVDKAVPKAILESMRRPGLTRENVASHLQKYRLYLKRTNAESQYHPMNSTQISTISEPTESKLERLEMEGFAQVHPDLLVHQHQHQHQHRPNRHHPNLYYYYNNNNNSLSEHSKNSVHDHSIVTGDNVASCRAMMENHVQSKNNMQLNYLQHRLHQQTQQENCSFVSPINVHHQLQDSAIGHPYGAQYGGHAPDQTAPVRDQGYAVPGGISAVKMEFPMNLSVSVVSSNGNTVNEPNVDLIDTPELGIPPDIPGYHPSLGYMSWDNR